MGLVTLMVSITNLWHISDTDGVNNQPMAFNDTNNVNNQPVALVSPTGVNNTFCGLLEPPRIFGGNILSLIITQTSSLVQNSGCHLRSPIMKFSHLVILCTEEIVLTVMEVYSLVAP